MLQEVCMEHSILLQTSVLGAHPPFIRCAISIAATMPALQWVLAKYGSPVYCHIDVR